MAVGDRFGDKGYAVLPILLVPLLAAAADYDVLIRNARVIDGTGNPWFRADVAVKDGRIAADRQRSAAPPPTRTIDARERVLAPGFIDVHTHVEGGVETESARRQFSAGRRHHRGHRQLRRLRTESGGVVRASSAKLGLGINVASLVGHNTVRREVMGSANRQATPDEIAKMQALVDRAMRDGAVGFSTGLEYVPGTYSNTAEVVALAKAAAAHGGVYTSHMRDEGIREIEAITEAVNVGKEAGMPVEISHLKIDRRQRLGRERSSRWR